MLCLCRPHISLISPVMAIPLNVFAFWSSGFVVRLDFFALRSGQAFEGSVLSNPWTGYMITCRYTRVYWPPYKSAHSVFKIPDVMFRKISISMRLIRSLSFTYFMDLYYSFRSFLLFKLPVYLSCSSYLPRNLPLRSLPKHSPSPSSSYIRPCYL